MTSPPPPARQRRATTRVQVLSFVPALDGLRGAAIVAVMLHNFSAVGATGVARALEWGWMGVQLFFVLSGFLITRILLEADRTPGVLRAFMARRALRVVPLYFATLFVYFVVVPRVFDAPTVVAAEPHQLWYWLFASNWGDPLGFGAPGLQHLWSIAVEIQFYLLWPLVAIGAHDRRLRRLCLAIVFLSLVSNVGLRVGWSASASAVYKFTITRMSAPAIGALAALLTRRSAWCSLYEKYSGALGWGSFGALLLLGAWRHGFQHTDAVVQTIGFALVALLCAQWLLTIVLGVPALGGAAQALPSWRPLRALGKLSYGMYVLHYPLHWAAMKVFGRALERGPWAPLLRIVYILAAIATTTGLAALSWWLFERRFIGLKRYFPLPRANGLDAAREGAAPPLGVAYPGVPAR
jgi:peptidoglycan/LPS O-acetylase OafA/YrhL